MMGARGLFLCVCVGHFVAVFSNDVPEYVDNLESFPLGNRLDFAPYDTVFSSLRSWSPDFHRLVDLPPAGIVPKVQVLCDETKLTVLVDKSTNDFLLSGEEIQLGHGCYSNGDLPEHFVFTYSFDQCGTNYVVRY